MNRLTACLLALSLAWYGPAAMALSVFDVIELTRNGYDEAEIERLIEVTNARFVIDVDSLLALGEANVEDEIIALMLERGAMPAEEPSATDQLIRLREAGFSEQTILRFVRHNNLCQPLADEDERRLGHAGFSSSFMRQFREQVEDCRDARETFALIEPLPEDAYEEAPTQVTRIYRNDTTVYPTTVRHPTTTYYPPSYYGIYDSYYYHDRTPRMYPIIVYRDYSGHRHRHGKPGHRARDNDRRKHDRDRRRDDRKGDRRRDRQKGDRDRRRRADSDTLLTQPQPRNDPNPRTLVDNPSVNAAKISPITRRMENRRRDRESTRPFVRSGAAKGARADLPTDSPGALPDRVRRHLQGGRAKLGERPVRPRSRGLPNDVPRRIERAERTSPRATSPLRPRVSAPPPTAPEPRLQPTRTPPAAPPPPVVKPPPLPVRVPDDVEWEDF